MIPKHIKHIPNKNRRAVAPYNFVELPEQIIKAEPVPQNSSYHQQRLAGKICCKLTTESPLYIRGGFTPQDFAKHGDQPSSTDYLRSEDKVTKKERSRRSDFFTYPDTQAPIIPGSSLRGMVRTLVEIISYGKIDKVTDSKLVYRSVGDTTSLKEDYRDRFVVDNSFQQQAGYLKRIGSDWAIQPAALIQGKPFARISVEATKPQVNAANKKQSTTSKPILKKQSKPRKGNHQAIRFQLTNKTDYTGLPIVEWVSSGGMDGHLVKTGKMQGKKYNCVFGTKDTDPKNAIPIPYDMVERYRDQITKEQIKLLGNNDDAALKEGQPIFYLIENDELTFFGHAMMFRLPYPSSVQKFIPEQLKSTEENAEVTDISEAIFGYVRDQKRSKNQVLKSRVSFSDAKCLSKEEDIWLQGKGNFLTPKILSSPKPTTFQHYLVQPKNTGGRKDSLNHYHSQPVEDTVIRGHKLYWHQGKVDTTQIEDSISKNSSQHTEIKPLKTGVCFEFDVHFDNLSEVELGALLWVFDIAQNKQYRLSLGMGKPLGMGAVKINYTLHLSDRLQRYQGLFGENSWAQPTNVEDENYIQAFENYVTKQLGVASDSFKQQTRIKMLLAMLAWTDSLSSEQKHRFRYMEIERSIQESHVIDKGSARKGKVNEYKNRPVLPTPLDIDDSYLSDSPKSRTAPSAKKGKVYKDKKQGSGKTAMQIALEQMQNKSKK